MCKWAPFLAQGYSKGKMHERARAVLSGQRQSGFRITIFDERTRGDNWKLRLERVVVAGE